MSLISKTGKEIPDELAARLRVLTAAQVLQIDELLDEVGEYGEVHLVMQRHQLRYINQMQSYKADEAAHNSSGAAHHPGSAAHNPSGTPPQK